MATISKRKRKDGTFSYTAQIRIRDDGELVYSEAKTFSKKALAQTWAKKREAELEEPGALEKLQHRGVTIGQLIERYQKERNSIAALGRSKSMQLDLISRQPFAKKDALQLSTGQVIEFIRERRLAGAGPSTVNNDLVWLGVVFRYARLAWEIPVNPLVIQDAAALARSERLISKSKRRSRRPTNDELARINQRYTELSRRRGTPPILLIHWFAIYSTRRLAEIMRVRISDLDREKRTWLIRDLKHPDGSEGNHQLMVVPDSLWQVIDCALELIPRDEGEDRLFPFNPKSMGTYWARQMKILEIEDLRFHDLRHEGASRLAEDGRTIPEIQQVTLHESWESLQRYVNMRPHYGERVEFPGCETMTN